MMQAIEDETIERAQKELIAATKIVRILKKIKDPVTRARILRAVAALYGLDERNDNGFSKNL